MDEEDSILSIKTIWYSNGPLLEAIQSTIMFVIECNSYQELPWSSADEKAAILDIKAVIDDDSLVNNEMQVWY